MKELLKVILIVATFFALTFVIVKLTGVLTVADIKSWLTQAQELSPLYVGVIVALLLFLDLFIAVPTLTLTILSGFFIGYGYGVLASLTGMMLAGVCGYGLSRVWGGQVLRLIVRDEVRRQEMKKAFHEHGFTLILLSRATPIMPEVSACLAGTTGFPFKKFLLAWSMCTVPFVLIAAYAGSVSSLDNPKPAILAAIGLTSVFWFGLYLFRRSQKNKREPLPLTD